MNKSQMDAKKRRKKMRDTMKKSRRKVPMTWGEHLAYLEERENRQLQGGR